MMTVNSVPDLDVGCVHDSFATHSCDIPVLAKALREAFVKIYSDDQLEKLKHAFIQSAGREETWMTPPERGDLDIRDVLTSTYFFF
jgi:DNA-directed RNA polymerase